jgi:hypothetical protein
LRIRRTCRFERRVAVASASFQSSQRLHVRKEVTMKGYVVALLVPFALILAIAKSGHAGDALRFPDAMPVNSPPGGRCVTLPEQAAFPAGGIVMWSGTAGDIPAGWLLCDGRNGTPDLTSRFVMGAGTNQPPHETGGSVSHNHPAELSWAFAQPMFSPAAPAANNDGLAEHLPPYYALCFIMKDHPFALDVKANGSDGPCRIAAGAMLSVSVNLHPANVRGKDADWWLLMHCPDQNRWYHYDASSASWRPGVAVSYQRPLTDFTAEVYQAPAAARERRAFIFAVDLKMDGKMRRNSLLTDQVQVIVEP